MAHRQHPPSWREAKTVIFLHIPKTGGSTLLTILKNQYRLVHQTQDNRLTDTDLAVLKAPTASGLQLVHGHNAFGIHELLPQPCTYITLIRHPVPRVVSLYNQIFRDTSHYLHQRVRVMSLKNFVTSGITKETTNWQVRQLNSRTQMQQARSDEILFANAQANLQNHFCVVGLTDQFDLSVLLMKQALGWKRCFYRPQNVTSKGQWGASEAAISLILEQNHLDLRLYEATKGVFQQLADSGSLKRDLTIYRISNHAYQSLYLPMQEITARWAD
jgi:hypothetical protein